MPAIKGRRNGPKKDNVEDVGPVVQENDDVSVEEDAQAPKSKGRAVMKKAKAADSKKDEDINEAEEVESVKNGKDDEDMAVEKSGAKPRGKAPAKKSTAKESDDAEDASPNKKAPKRGNSAKDSNDEETVEAVKPKKVGKKEEVLPTRRGGDRAAKKVVAYETEEKAPAKKGRGGKGNGVSKVAAKDDSKKRGRQGKKGKGDTETDDAMETPDVTETPATTVSVEHCKS